MHTYAAQALLTQSHTPATRFAKLMVTIASFWNCDIISRQSASRSALSPASADTFIATSSCACSTLRCIQEMEMGGGGENGDEEADTREKAGEQLERWLQLAQLLESARVGGCQQLR